MSWHRAISTCQVALVVIGPRWLSAAAPDGGRRLDAPGDFVRLEVAEALRGDALPAELAPLSLRQAIELRDLGWRDGVESLLRVIDSIVGVRRAARRRLPLAAAMAGTLLAGALAWTWLASREGRETATALRGPTGEAFAASTGAPMSDTPPGGGVLIDDTFLEERRLGVDDQPFFGNSAYCRTAYRPDGLLIEARSDLPCQYVVYSAEFLPDPGTVAVSMRLMRRPAEPGREAYGLGVVEASPADPDSALSFRGAVSGIDNFVLMRDRRDEPEILARPRPRPSSTRRSAPRTSSRWPC